MSDLKPELVTAFFAAQRERERVRIMRSMNLPRPWTKDPALLNFRFCNVFREHDKTTAWFRETMRNQAQFSRTRDAILMTTVAFRWFNKIEIGEVLRDSAIGLAEGRFDGDQARSRIRYEYPNGPFVNGAYIIKTPDGKNKLDGVIWCIEQVAAKAEQTAQAIYASKSLEKAAEILKAFPFMGDFMAYEVVTDLRFTRLLGGATDTDTWANPGPGAARGLSRMLGEAPETLSRNNRTDRARMVHYMRELLALSRHEFNWPMAWGRWELREVEHGLCEFDKLLRVREGGRMKQKFNGENQNGR